MGMPITPEKVAEKLGAYLRHELPVAQLVAWAEAEIMDGDFASSVIRDVVARLGLADVRAFGLTWEDCERMLRDLGFEARVDIVTA